MLLIPSGPGVRADPPATSAATIPPRSMAWRSDIRPGPNRKWGIEARRMRDTLHRLSGSARGAESPQRAQLGHRHDASRDEQRRRGGEDGEARARGRRALVGSSSSPPTPRPRQQRDDAAPAARHSNGTANSRRVSRCRTATASRRRRRTARCPAPAMPSGPTSVTRSTTLTTSPATVAGKLRVVTFARPATVTKHQDQPVERPAQRDPRQRLVTRRSSSGVGEQPHEPSGRAACTPRRPIPVTAT